MVIRSAKLAIANLPKDKGVSGSRMTATRVRPGTVSLTNSSHLPPIACSKLVKPVTLPPEV
jgi:hypothetical protein